MLQGPGSHHCNKLLHVLPQNSERSIDWIFSLLPQNCSKLDVSVEFLIFLKKNLAPYYHILILEKIWYSHLGLSHSRERGEEEEWRREKDDKSNSALTRWQEFPYVTDFRH